MAARWRKFTLDGETRSLKHRNAVPARRILSLSILCCCIVAALPAAAAAQERPEAGREHVVKRGDTLWDLARSYLANPYLWPQIFEANRGVVENPHWIYPAEKLLIPGLEGGREYTGSMDQAGPTVAVRPQPEDARTRFYHPPAPVDSSRELVLAAKLLAPYVVSPTEYAGTPWLADSAKAGVVGRVLRMADPADQRDRLVSALHPYMRVQAGLRAGVTTQVGDTVMLVRFEQTVRGHGRVVLPVAMLHVDSISASLASTTVIRQYSEARVGDWMIQTDPVPAIARGLPSEVAEGAEGRLLAFVDASQLYGMTDLAFVDLGDGQVGIGDELIAFVPPHEVGRGAGSDLPPEAVATLRVVKVNDHSATVRVVGLRSTSLEKGLAVRVIRKM